MKRVARAGLLLLFASGVTLQGTAVFASGNCANLENTMDSVSGPTTIEASGPIGFNLDTLGGLRTCDIQWTVNSPITLTAGDYFLGSTMDFLYELTLTSSELSPSGSLKWNIHTYIDGGGPEEISHSGTVLISAAGTENGSVLDTLDSSTFPAYWTLAAGDYTFVQVVTLTLEGTSLVDGDTLSGSFTFPVISQLTEAPEPGSWLMVGAGCLALGLKRLRQP